MVFSLRASLVRRGRPVEDNGGFNPRAAPVLPVLLVLIGLLAASDPAPATQTPAPAVPAAPSGPAPAPAEGAQPGGAPATKAGPDQAPVDAEDDQSAAPAVPLAPVPTPPAAGPDGPAPYSDVDAKAYSDAVLAAAKAEQAMQGPLDGGWSLDGSDGRALYSFRMVDHGQGMASAEGAWRDLQPGAGPDASGFVDSIGYDGEKLMLRFHEAGPDDLVVVTLKPAGAKRWPGELWRHGAVAKVTFARAN